MAPSPSAQPDGGAAAAPNIDRFEVRISNVRGDLRTAEPRPVFLAFDFDKGFVRRETSVYSQDVSPVWAFPQKPGASKGAAPPPDTAFLYRTEYAHRMHKKYLAVSLSERSPHGDVVWGSGAVSLDSLARGCEHVALNMIARDGVTCYGTIRFSVSMVNVAEVSVFLSDLKLLDYPERFAHDTKLVYFEFGFTGFEDGYRVCTERCADSEPRFYSRPALKRDCKLREMVSPAPTPRGPLRVFFSVHRQVARNRTEQIGLGALPVRMLFQKVTDGWMDVPTKFKVPLKNGQGTLKGKVLLRNIPRFHQLPGEDLVNVNGVITPIDVDLSQRKIVPWMKLPRSLESQLRKPAPPPVTGPAAACPPHDGPRVSNASSNSDGVVLYESAPSSGTGFQVSAAAAAAARARTRPRPRSPVAPAPAPADVVVHSHGSYEPAFEDQAAADAVRVVQDPDTPPSLTHVAPFASLDISSGIGKLSLGGGAQQGAPRAQPVETVYAQQPGETVYVQQAAETVHAQQPAETVYTQPPAETVYTQPPAETVYAQQPSGMVYAQQAAETAYAQQAVETVYAQQPAETVYAQAYSPGPSETGTVTPVRRTKSGTRVGSFGDAKGELGSVLHSTVSEDGLVSSRVSADGQADAEWIAVEDPSSGLFYYANRVTHESLWLPPDWECEKDADGRPVFVDYGSGGKQYAFPADEARKYRATVYSE